MFFLTIASAITAKTVFSIIGGSLIAAGTMCSTIHAINQEKDNK